MFAKFAWQRYPKCSPNGTGIIQTNACMHMLIGWHAQGTACAQLHAHEYHTFIPQACISTTMFVIFVSCGRLLLIFESSMAAGLEAIQAAIDGPCLRFTQLVTSTGTAIWRSVRLRCPCQWSHHWLVSTEKKYTMCLFDCLSPTARSANRALWCIGDPSIRTASLVCIHNRSTFATIKSPAAPTYGKGHRCRRR